MGPGAWIILLQAAATYAGIASSYFFARPAFRGEATQSSREILGAVRTTDKDTADLVQKALDALSQAAVVDLQSNSIDNRRAILLLLLSLALFTGAVVLQALGDPAFR